MTKTQNYFLPVVALFGTALVALMIFFCRQQYTEDVQKRSVISQIVQKNTEQLGFRNYALYGSNNAQVTNIWVDQYQMSRNKARIDVVCCLHWTVRDQITRSHFILTSTNGKVYAGTAVWNIGEPTGSHCMEKVPIVVQ